MTTTNLRKIQLIDLEILRQLVKVLDEHKLQYYLIGGTLLGAVRHKGFIPWDDDMDIAMPRDAYEVFLKKYQKQLPKNYLVENYKNNFKFKYNITRICDMRYKVKELRNSDNLSSQTYVSIDIFPIDGVPNKNFERKLYYFNILSKRALLSLINKNNIDYARKRNVLEKLTISIGTKLPLKKYISANGLQFKIDQLLKKQNSKSLYAGTIMGAYRTLEIVPRKYFGEGKLVEFEGSKFMGPKMADAYLTHMYGDYMQIPSIEEQESKKHFSVEKV